MSTIISGAESFLLRADHSTIGSTVGSRGVLLIHGFTGNPAELRLLGEHLRSMGLTVLCVRLAGHATTVDDLIRATRADWFHSVLDGLSILNGLCDSISIVGHSMGGLLGLQATLGRVKIDRLVTLAAPIFIDEALRLRELPPLEQCVGLTIQKPRRRLQNVPRGANEVYRNMPLLGVHELVGVIDETKKILERVTIPILIMHGRSDHTAQPRSAEYIFEHVRSTEKTLEMIEGMGHLLPLTDGRERIFARTAEFLRR